MSVVFEKGERVFLKPIAKDVDHCYYHPGIIKAVLGNDQYVVSYNPDPANGERLIEQTVFDHRICKEADLMPVCKGVHPDAVRLDQAVFVDKPEAGGSPVVVCAITGNRFMVFTGSGAKEPYRYLWVRKDRVRFDT